jgi:hypothetical protein
MLSIYIHPMVEAQLSREEYAEFVAHLKAAPPQRAGALILPPRDTTPTSGTNTVSR